MLKGGRGAEAGCVDAQAGPGKGDPNDSDEELVVGGTEFSLRCPLSGSRIRTPARFVGVPGLTAFDLETFLGMVKRSKKWQCPHSMRNLPVQDLMLDGYLSRVLPRLQVCITLQAPNLITIKPLLCSAIAFKKVHACIARGKHYH